MIEKRPLIINGFHASTNSNTDGIGEFIRAVDAAGVPVMIKAVRSTAGLIDLQNAHNKSGVEHIAVYRQDYFPHNQGGSDVPDYNKEPEIAAVEQWQSHIFRWPSELDPSFVWGESINELRKEVAAADWIGRFCYQTAQLAIKAGRRWMGPGYSAGTPDDGVWETPAMLKFLKLASEHRDQVGIALHEYSLNPGDLFDGVGYKIGRFVQLVKACHKAGFEAPDIYFTEWGWGERSLPEPDQAMGEIDSAMADIYAPYTTVKGAAIWALDKGWGDLDKQAHDLMRPLQDMLINNRYEVEVDNKPMIKDTSNIRFRTNLIPQDTTEAERDEIARLTYPAKEGIEYSADFAGMVAYGRDDSEVVIWGPDRWADDIGDYMVGNYGVRVVYRKMPGAVNGYPIPRDRAEMPMIVDVSKWQCRVDQNGNYVADTIDWQQIFTRASAAIVRASVGAKVDPAYLAWTTQIGKRKKPRGNYHFLHPDIDSATQVDVFLGHRIEGVLGDWLDVERLGSSVPTAEQVIKFIERYKMLTGKNIGIYTNYDAWFYYIKLGFDVVGDNDLWIASFESSPGSLLRPVVPLPWDAADWGITNERIKIWQYTKGRLPGYARDIDINAWHGSTAEFEAMIEARGGVIDPGDLPPQTRPVLIGLHAGADGGDITDRELAEFKALKPGVIKVLSGHSGRSVGQLASDHPSAVFIVRAFLSMHGRTISPGNFVEWTFPDVARAVASIGLNREIWIELHNEPNLTFEGLGSSWRDGKEFNTWLLEVIRLYRQRMTGNMPGVKLLFPGLSPGGDVPNLRINSDAFRNDCKQAIGECDGLAIHTYWASGSGWPMTRAVDEARVIALKFNGLPVWVTEASNNKSIDDAATKAAEYAEFPTLLDIANDNIQGVAYFVASASNPGWGWNATGSAETWIDVSMGKRVRSILDQA